MFNTAPSSDFLAELSKDNLDKARLKDIFVQSMIAADAAAARETVAATKDAKAAAEREAAAAWEVTAATKEAAAATKEAAAAKGRAIQAEASLKMRSFELLRTRGLLSARGAIEYIEEEERPKYPGPANKSRHSLWTNILEDNLELQDCLAQSSVFGRNRPRHTVTADGLAREIVGVYKTLSNHIHNNKSPAEYSNMGDTLLIIEDHLSKRQCRALQCVFEAFGFPAELKLKMDGDSD